MNTSLRRKERAVSEEDALRIFDTAEYGVLSLSSDDEFPYGIPVNFARKDDILYIHCAPEGRKIDCIKKNPKGSICAVGKTSVLPERLTLAYESAIAFGEMRLLDDENEKIAALTLIGIRFCPANPEKIRNSIEKLLHRTAVIEFKIIGISGKRKI